MATLENVDETYNVIKQDHGLSKRMVEPRMPFKSFNRLYRKLVFGAALPCQKLISDKALCALIKYGDVGREAPHITVSCT